MYTDGLGRQAYLPSSSNEKDKVRAVGCFRTRDGRYHINIQTSTTIGTGKAIFILLIGLMLFSYLFGLGNNSALRKRVTELERAMGKKLSWVLQHQKLIRKALSSNQFNELNNIYLNTGGPIGPNGLHADGRRHLLTPPDSVSKLAENLAPNTQIANFDDHYLCGENPITEAETIRKTLAIVAITWRAPLSLRNSMESWRRGGLLDLVDERMIFINSPSEEDYAIANEYDFDIYTTQEHDGNIMAGPALAYLVGNSTADYILFMEKDFVLSADKPTTMRELYTGVQHLARGVDVYRLRGKTDHPAEGMPDCCAKVEPPNCPYNSGWKSAGYFQDHMNWLYIFCDPNIMESANGRVAHCTSEPNAPDSYCFTSGETNWSNNPVIFPREWFNNRLREVAFRDWERNNMLEFNVMMEWLPWRPPAKVCVSFQGIFTHVEIDQ